MDAAKEELFFQGRYFEKLFADGSARQLCNELDCGYSRSEIETRPREVTGAGEPELKPGSGVGAESLTFLHKVANKIKPAAVYDVTVIWSTFVRFAFFL